jgi:hypothetical protein
MGEQKRRAELGLGTRAPLRPGEVATIEIDVKNAEQQRCEKCDCPNFIAAVSLYKVSALLSPTGQELMAQVPVLVCLDCGQPFLMK